MSFYTGDATIQQPTPILDGTHEMNKVSEESSNQFRGSSSSSSTSSKRQIESHPFVNQFSEVEKAISNFTKHQPFNHHYAPNVHPNRSHNNHYNNSRFNNNNNNNMSNGRFHQQAPMVQQFKNHQQSQQQQGMNGNATGLQNRFQKLMGQQQQLQVPQQDSAVLQQQQQQIQQQQLLQQYQSLVQAQQQLPVQQQVSQPFLSNDSKFDIFQQPQEISLPLRNPSPAFSSSIRSNSDMNSAFPISSPLEQINTGYSFGLGPASDMISTPASNPVLGGANVDKNISLDESTTYLGDIWGNSKGLRSSTSVWA